LWLDKRLPTQALSCSFPRIGAPLDAGHKGTGRDGGLHVKSLVGRVIHVGVAASISRVHQHGQS
jgi:hypothetical protein